MNSHKLPLTKAVTRIGLMLAFTVLGHVSASASEPLAAGATIQNDTLTLGTAYHSEKDGYYALQSVLGRIDESLGNTEMDFVVGVDMGYTQLANMLNGNLGAQLDLPVIKVNAGASYAKQQSADDYTGTYTLYLAMKPKKRTLLPANGEGFAPTQVAADLAGQYPGDKFNRVGDEFVSAIEYGSQVMVNLKFQYKNKADKVKWGGQLDVDWVGKVRLGGKLESVDNATKKDIKITVSATQFGGTPNELLKIIPNQLVNCTMENPAPCFAIFANTIDYIKTQYVTQFTKLDRYNVARVYTEPYRRSGPNLQPLVPDGPYPSRSLLTKLAVKNMSEAWIQALMDNRRADNLLSYYASELAPDQRNALQDIRDNALFNSFILADSVGYCDDNPIGPFCRDRELATKTRLSDYDRSWLDL
jgi:hypothetical protein